MKRVVFVLYSVGFLAMAFFAIGINLLHDPRIFVPNWIILGLAFLSIGCTVTWLLDLTQYIERK